MSTTPDPTNEQLVSMLSDTLNTPGWKKLIKPAAIAVSNIYNVGLVNGEFIDEKTKRVIPIDECRAVIKTFQWLLGWEARLEGATLELAAAAAQTPAAEIPGGSPLVAQPD